MRRRHVRKPPPGRVSLSAALGALLLLAVSVPGQSASHDPPVEALLIRDDDGTMEATLTVDYFDDIAVKRLFVPLGLDPGETALLWIYGRSFGCGPTGPTNLLTVNRVPLDLHDPCDIWAATSFKWRSFRVPPGLLLPGTMNSFKIAKLQGFSFSTRNLLLGVDQDNDFGRSDALANGVDVPGELMWYLELKPLTTVVPKG